MVKRNWDTEELIENWTLLPQELELVRNKVGGNQIGFAFLLKHFQIFARFPDNNSPIPQIIISYIANQINISESCYSDFDLSGRSARVYRAEIRRLFNFRVATVTDSEQMIEWLIEEILPNEQRFEAIKEIVALRWRELQIEPPTTLQVERLIRSAIAKHETNFCNLTFSQLTPKAIAQIDLLLTTDETTETAEYKATGTAYRRRVHNMVRASFAGHYRRMIPQLLEVLEFRSNNDIHRPVIEALELLKKYAHSKARYYDPTEEIPIDGVLKSNAKEILLETDSEGQERINRINYEICVLKALRERLCCKEIWVVGANRYRNPDDDLPTDFESKRQVYYQALTLPENVETFIRSLQQQMESGLEKLDREMPRNKGVAIVGKGNKGLIRLSGFDAAPEPVNIKQLKGEINRLWHKTSLLDILKETDLRVDFTRNFKSMGTREILDRETLQKRLLLCLFGMGTNTGLKRINTGIDGENYQDLIYVRRRYIHKDQLRSACAEVVNATFEIRLPHIWGEGTTTCASDSKHFGAWEQNLITQYHLRYGGRGVMIYWHVEKNSTCIYSQLKTCSSSEVAAM